MPRGAPPRGSPPRVAPVSMPSREESFRLISLTVRFYYSLAAFLDGLPMRAILLLPLTTLTSRVPPTALTY